jgi:cold shock CspA family protein
MACRVAVGHAQREGLNELRGTLRVFHRGRGFGFIAQDTGDEHFVHARQLHAAGIEYPVTGMEFEYELKPSERKHGMFEACQLRLLDRA